MLTIHKYSIGVGKNILHLPSTAKILDAGYQSSALVVWALLDDALQKEPREILVTGTGWNLERWIISGLHIRSIQAGEYVWHVFELPSNN